MLLRILAAAVCISFLALNLGNCRHNFLLALPLMLLGDLVLGVFSRDRK